MSERFFEAEEGLLQTDVDPGLQVVTLALKHWVLKLYYFHVDIARSDIDVLVSSVFVCDDVAVGAALFHPDVEAVHAVSQSFALAQVACRCFNLACAGAFIALNLELLHHAGHDLLPFNDLTLASAVRARRDVVGVVSTAAATVRANYHSIILQFKVGARVKLFKRHGDLQAD